MTIDWNEDDYIEHEDALRIKDIVEKELTPRYPKGLDEYAEVYKMEIYRSARDTKEKFILTDFNAETGYLYDDGKEARRVKNDIEGSICMTELSDGTLKVINLSECNKLGPVRYPPKGKSHTGSWNDNWIEIYDDLF